MKKNNLGRLIPLLLLLVFFSSGAFSLPTDPAAILVKIQQLQKDTDGLASYFKKDLHQPLLNNLQSQLDSVYLCVEAGIGSPDPVTELAVCQSELGSYSQTLNQTFGSGADLQALHIKYQQWKKAQGQVTSLLTQAGDLAADLDQWMASSGTNTLASTPDPQSILYAIIALPRYIPGAVDLRRSLYFSTRYAAISTSSGQRSLADGDTVSAATQFSYARLRINAYKTLLENRLAALPAGSAPEIQQAIDQASAILRDLNSLIPSL